MSEKLFETAARTKMRFPYRGEINVEDLWDLSVRELDKIFKILNSRMKQVVEESLLKTKTAEDEELDLQISIIKYIVVVKQDEIIAREQSKANKEQRQKIMSILAEKQDQDMRNKTPEELQAMLNALS